ncbi:hypothetical protein PR048_017580 [Dryococelus australis]|uniref:VOC domain-containing protein n=1 Tax=Dryococelus australis TaxID=614101 RepID=A0ABQ9H9Z8_9NEOP|nr:hypothetical protein PR048_017580 [Dryococelus australis]
MYSSQHVSRSVSQKGDMLFGIDDVGKSVAIQRVRSNWSWKWFAFGDHCSRGSYLRSDLDGSTPLISEIVATCSLKGLGRILANSFVRRRREDTASSTDREDTDPENAFRPNPGRPAGPGPLPVCAAHCLSMGSGGAAAGALAPPPRRSGLDPGEFAPGFSHVGIVLDDAACRRVFSGYSRFPRHCIPAPLHPRVSLHVVFRDDGHLQVPTGKPVTRRVLPRPGSEGRTGSYCVSGLTPYAYKEGKSCKETCIVAKRDWVAMACTLEP